MSAHNTFSLCRHETVLSILKVSVFCELETPTAHEPRMHITSAWLLTQIGLLDFFSFEGGLQKDRKADLKKLGRE